MAIATTIPAQVTARFTRLPLPRASRNLRRNLTDPGLLPGRAFGPPVHSRAAGALGPPVVAAGVAVGRAASKVPPDAQGTPGLPAVVGELAVDVEMLATASRSEVAVEPVPGVDPHRRRWRAHVADRRGPVVAL